ERPLFFGGVYTDTTDQYRLYAGGEEGIFVGHLCDVDDGWRRKVVYRDQPLQNPGDVGQAGASDRCGYPKSEGVGLPGFVAFAAYQCGDHTVPDQSGYAD